MPARARSTRLRVRARAGLTGEELIEPRKARGRDRAAALRQGRERGLEHRVQAEPRDDPAKPDDLAAHRERRHELPALQRLGLVRQHREAAVQMPVPVAARPPARAGREAAQIAHGERQEPARAQRRRQWRQHAERKRRGPDTCEDGDRGVVEARGVVGHLVGRRQERHEVDDHGGKHRRPPRLGAQRPDRNQIEPKRDREAREGRQPRQHRKRDDGRQDRREDRAHHEIPGHGIGLVGARREQQDPDRGEGDGQRAVWPCRHDPEQLGDADRHQGAPGIDPGRQPVGHAQPDAAMPLERAAPAGDQQGQPLQRLRRARHCPSALVGEQPQRRRAGGQGDQRPRRRLADPLQTGGVGHPAGRRGAVRRPSQLLRNPAQHGLRLAPGRLIRQRREVDRHAAPAGHGGEQSVHRALQHRRVVAEIGGLADRLVDDRIERRGPPDERASDRLRVRQARAGLRQGAREAAHDLGRQRREQRREAARRAAEIGPGEDDPGAHDADADFARAVDRDQEDLPVGAAGRAERAGGDDRGRVAGERRRVGREVAQQRGDQAADGAPQGQTEEKRDALLREARGQDDDRYGAHHRADHAEPPLAQRSAEMRLTHQRRGGARPERIVELEPERDVEGEADRSPKAQPEQQRRPRSAQRIRRSRPLEMTGPPPRQAAKPIPGCDHLAAPLSPGLRILRPSAGLLPLASAWAQ